MKGRPTSQTESDRAEMERCALWNVAHPVRGADGLRLLMYAVFRKPSVPLRTLPTVRSPRKKTKMRRTVFYS